MDSQVSSLLLLLSPLFFICIGVEAYFLYRRQSSYHWRDSLCSISLGLLHEGMAKLTWFCVLPLYLWIYQDYRLYTLGFDWQSFLSLLLAQDFLYYWLHRNAHRIRWFWSVHSVHHSSSQFNFSTAFRQSALFPITGIWLFLLPMAWLGFSPELAVGTALLNLAYQFFIHTQLIPALGWLEYVFNTPSTHRVHHALNKPYLNHNFGGILSLWDRLFGTFIAEDKTIPCQYGTVKAVDSFNPFIVLFADWQDITQDLRSIPHWQGRLVFLFGPPKAAKSVLKRHTIVPSQEKITHD
jgi:sterol desaturase/sphingolipid hydroxylase (fatty acid hydroxylase superfamily)